MAPLARVKRELDVAPDAPLMQVVVDRHYLAEYARYHEIGSLEEASDDLARRLHRVFGLASEALTVLFHETLEDQPETASQTGFLA